MSTNITPDYGQILSQNENPDATHNTSGPY